LHGELGPQGGVLLSGSDTGSGRYPAPGRTASGGQMMPPPPGSTGKAGLRRPWHGPSHGCRHTSQHVAMTATRTAPAAHLSAILIYLHGPKRLSQARAHTSPTPALPGNGAAHLPGLSVPAGPPPPLFGSGLKSGQLDSPSDSDGLGSALGATGGAPFGLVKSRSRQAVEVRAAVAMGRLVAAGWGCGVGG
jgi:hypothetical protein